MGIGLLLIVTAFFWAGAATGRMIGKKNDNRGTVSRRLMESYDKLLKDANENNADMRYFFNERIVVIYGLRGKFGRDFFKLIDEEVEKSLVYSDGNAAVLKSFRGKKVFEKKEVCRMEFDYLVILPLNHFEDIYNDFLNEGVDHTKMCSMVDVLYYEKLGEINA